MHIGEETGSPVSTEADGSGNYFFNSIISIRTKFIDEHSDEAEQITAQLQKDYTNPELISVSSVGPTMGKELFKNSLICILT